MSNNIANKIEAKDKNLAKVFITERYKIDVFQREYRWQKKHIEALITDLSISFLDNYKEGDTIEKYDTYDNYYVGPIVVCNDGGSLSIVDGQQRLTSFTLLLIYLRHLQDKLDLPENLQKDLKQYLYVTKGGRTSLILDIEPREKIIKHLYENPDIAFGEDIKDESVTNIIQRYEDISVLFPEEIRSKDILPLFIEWLLDKVVVVEVKAFSIENAYTIFETMNDRGMNLSPTEMLKGYLLSKIAQIEKSVELNDFWKTRIAQLRALNDQEADLEFFRAWLRAKYAETVRSTKQGSENEDFELIGTQFHNWVKKHAPKIGLINSDDYYFFVRSDFDFYSSLYQTIYGLKTVNTAGLESIYVSNQYTIADSLAYPIYLSSITKLDGEDEILTKIKIVDTFIDIYINYRTLLGKAITQSSIRYSMYELIKNIRNSTVAELKEKLSLELGKTLETQLSPFSTLQRMDNWGYYHYFFARILYSFQDPKTDFSSFLRSRKQSSFVLFKIWHEDDFKPELDEAKSNLFLNSVAGFCLVRRYEVETISSILDTNARLTYLLDHNYLPEMISSEWDLTQLDAIEFIVARDKKLSKLTSLIWNFN